jgi:hypothetical protein
VPAETTSSFDRDETNFLQTLDLSFLEKFRHFAASLEDVLTDFEEVLVDLACVTDVVDVEVVVMRLGTTAELSEALETWLEDVEDLEDGGVVTTFLNVKPFFLILVVGEHCKSFTLQFSSELLEGVQTLEVLS